MKFNWLFIAEIAMGGILASMLLPLFSQMWGKVFKQSWDDTE